MHPAAAGRALAMATGTDFIVLDRDRDQRLAEIKTAGEQKKCAQESTRARSPAHGAEPCEDPVLCAS
jgi:hypothetical protein